jgi:hypothetical protein
MAESQNFKELLLLLYDCLVKYRIVEFSAAGALTGAFPIRRPARFAHDTFLICNAFVTIHGPCDLNRFCGPHSRSALPKNAATLRFAGAFRTGESACPTFFYAPTRRKWCLRRKQ